jgi:hypothetical protein
MKSIIRKARYSNGPFQVYCNINLHSKFKYCEEISSTTWRQRSHNEEVAAPFMFAAKYLQGKYRMAKRAFRDL